MVALFVYVRKEGDATWSQIVPLQDQSFNLSKKLIDLNEIGSLRCESSKTLLFPSEFDLNNTFFGNFKSFTSGTFNAFDFYEAKVELLDTTIVLQGSLYFKGYNRTNRCYEVNIASKVGTIKSRLESQTLGDLRSDLLALYDHPYTWDTIRGTFTTRLNNRVAYAAIDNGVGLGDGHNLNTTATDMSKLFYPMINLKQSIADIFNHLDIPFVDNTLIDDSAMICIGGSKDNFVKLKDSTLVSPDQFISGNFGTNVHNLEFTTLTGEFIRIPDITNYYFTVNKSGLYSINFSAIITNPTFSMGTTIRFCMGDSVIHAAIITIVENETANINYTFQLNLRASESYNIKIEMPKSNYESLTIKSNVAATGYPLVIELLKKVKLIDLITMYRSDYDVYYVQIGDTIHTHTYKTLTGLTSTPIDLSSNIEYKSGISYNSLINFISSRYRYLKATSKSYFNNRAIQADGIAIGSLDMGLPITSQLPPQEIKLLTTTWVNSVAGDLQFERNYAELGKPQANDVPMYLAFFIGPKTVASYKILDEGGIERADTVWPIYDNTKSGQMLSFNRIDLFSGNNDNSTAISLFEKYHYQKYYEWFGLNIVNGINVALNPIDLRDARLEEADVWIDEMVFKSLTLGEKIYIATPEGNYNARLLEITNFDMSGRKPAKCKFIKIVKEI